MCQSFLPSFAGSIEKAYNFDLGIAKILPQHFYCSFLGAKIWAHNQPDVTVSDLLEELKDWVE